METEVRVDGARWPRLTIGVLMILIAAAAALFALVRPYDSSRITHQAAIAIKADNPEFDVRQYPIVSIMPSADRRYFGVMFRRAPGGPGRSAYATIVAAPAR